MTIVTIAGNKSQLSTSTARTPKSSTSESAGHQPNSAVLWRRIATPTHSAAKLATASARVNTTTPRRGGVNSSWIERNRAVIILGLYPKRRAGGRFGCDRAMRLPCRPVGYPNDSKRPGRDHRERADPVAAGTSSQQARMRAGRLLTAHYFEIIFRL